MSISPTPNPLKHVLNAIGEDVEWLTYGEETLQVPAQPFGTKMVAGVLKILQILVRISSRKGNRETPLNGGR